MANQSVLEAPDVRNGAPADEPLTDDMALVLALMDGELTPAAAAEARARLENDPVCGPMLREWSGLSRALTAAFDDAAERAKPDLATVADRVLQEAFPSRPPQSQGFFARFARFASRVQAPVAFAAAAAAIGLVLLPLLRTTPADPTPVTALAPTRPDPVAPALKAEPEAKPNDVIVRQISFEHADGMVYRTRKGGMTVIWISEHEGA